MFKKTVIIIILLAGIFLFLNSNYVTTALGTDVISGVKNIPNPFRAWPETTIIRYMLSVDCKISINIYNLIGDIVRKYDENECPGSSGINQKEWDGKNGLGRMVADGCYICEIIAMNDEGIVIDRELLKIAVLK